METETQERERGTPFLAYKALSAVIIGLTPERRRYQTVTDCKNNTEGVFRDFTGFLQRNTQHTHSNSIPILKACTVFTDVLLFTKREVRFLRESFEDHEHKRTDWPWKAGG